MQKNKYALEEEEILKFWEKNKIFERSITERPENKPYVFYDGPPFATGLPHYGHILSSTVKDVFPRYQTMKGKRVDRRWGWDCHGLPIENIAEKELGIKTKKQIEEFGVEKFNEFCRSKVLEYAEEWKKVIHRLGRWADMENAYKTMDPNYMESVWWVFKELWDKGLIYEGYRSMHICPRCETTLSQSEVAEGYKDIKDLSVVAKFHLKSGQKFADGKYEIKDSAYILAWTTTPWTLIGNVALAVGENIKYTALRIDGSLYIIATDRIEDVFADQKYEIVHNDLVGKDLVGLKYEPLFETDNKIENSKNGWQVVPADFVTTEDGTGIVHVAPAFGEDDLNLSKKLNLPFIQHIGMDGIIKSGYGEFSGLSVKPAGDVQITDVAVMKYLDGKNLLFDKTQYEHSYPHCWRCETPLINYATSSWFVAVEKVKNEAIKLSKDIDWMPNHIKDGRFGMWLKGARDWSISRQRYWASVIPIWVCDQDSKHQKVIGSIKELEDLSSQKVTDLHKHIIDKVVFKCDECSGKMKRIPDVLDTWFDSGSMPYAQMHYPFEHKEKFEDNFPAEFIGEGIDQTRAWFYYLHILSTAIMHKSAYRNVAVNGIVLAEDGKKMSKRLNNYPDPMKIFDQYGADALRFYLMGSTVMQAENLFFSELELREAYNKVINTLNNILSFYKIYKGEIKDAEIENAHLPAIDRYILSRLESSIEQVEESFTKYDSVKACRQIRLFIEDFSVWWLRRSRERFRSEQKNEREIAMTTLKYVLLKTSQMIAPLLPFTAESIWQEVKLDDDPESVHLSNWPKANKQMLDENLEQIMGRARRVVETGHSLRQKNSLKVRQPLAQISFAPGFGDFDDEIIPIILEELNIEKSVSKNEIKSPDSLEDHELEVTIDTEIDERLQGLGDLRDIIRAIQNLRKNMDLSPSEKVSVIYFADEKVKKFIESNNAEIKSSTNLDELSCKETDQENKVEISLGSVYFKVLK
ncbi:MAG: isoleucine--tRNA ligase [bacterium]